MCFASHPRASRYVEAAERPSTEQRAGNRTSPTLLGNIGGLNN